MAKIDILAPFILSWEGGFVNDPNDSGGATNKGITIGTWKKHGYDKDGDHDIDINDLKLITNQDVIKILKTEYWDKWKADSIKDQSIANLLVDWLWHSGVYGIKIPQKTLGLKSDGIVGTKTLNAINNGDPKALFYTLRNARLKYLSDLCKSNKRYQRSYKGWMNRVFAIDYGFLECNNHQIIKF